MRFAFFAPFASILLRVLRLEKSGYAPSIKSTPSRLGSVEAFDQNTARFFSIFDLFFSTLSESNPYFVKDRRCNSMPIQK